MGGVAAANRDAPYDIVVLRLDRRTYGRGAWMMRNASASTEDRLGRAGVPGGELHSTAAGGAAGSASFLLADHFQIGLPDPGRP